MALCMLIVSVFSQWQRTMVVKMNLFFIMKIQFNLNQVK